MQHATAPSTVTDERRTLSQTLGQTLRTNWFFGLVALFLIVLPHLIGWSTGSSPFGLRGRAVGESTYWQALLIEVFILAILAMSYNLMFGFTGVISFGHALFFGLGGYILGLFMRLPTLQLGDNVIALSLDARFALGLVVGLLLCGALGLVMGLVSLRLRGVYFAMFTLAVAEMVNIFFARLPATGSEDGFSIADVPEWLNPVRNRLAFYYVALMLVCLTFLFLRRLIQSPTGAVLLAIRENENRAQSIGYNTLVFKLIAIILAGLLAALAGMLSVMLNKKVGPELLNVSYTVDPLLMTIIGGIGTHTGPVIGAAVLHLSDRLLRNQLAIGNAWTLVQGIGFIVVVLVLPGGIAQLWRRNPASKPRAPEKSQPEVESSKAVVP